ncbi:MAG: hypothetical protein MUE84_07335 [Hyphomonas sp.]|jgi:hypothetical protein|nr:hypothetical protein [Hyphomonas sp.]
MFRKIITTALVAAALCQPAAARDVAVGVHGDNNTVVVYAPTYKLQLNQPSQLTLKFTRFGQFCWTRFGVSGPGEPLPVGSACVVDTPFGPHDGVIR